MHDSYRPANDPERVLVDQIAANSWRLMRAQRVETAFMSKLAEGSENPDMAIAAALLDRPKDLARIARYMTAAENAYYKAVRELGRLQKERAVAEQHEAIVQAYMKSVESTGFVSKSRGTGLPAKASAQPAEQYAMPGRLHDAPSALQHAAC
jgi:hypothetical protein